MVGAPPPPPPAPGMMLGSTVTSNNPKPKKPMKSLNWDKIPDVSYCHFFILYF